MIQLHAGYAIDCVVDSLKEKYGETKINGLLKYLSHFDVDIQSSSEGIDNEIDIIKVASNLVSRGLPTRPSINLENVIHENLMLSFKDDEIERIGGIQYICCLTDSDLDLLYKALHIVDPRLGKGNDATSNFVLREVPLGSSFEAAFLYSKVPELLSPALIQLIATQTEFESMLIYSGIDKEELKYFSKRLYSQRTDFAIEFPYDIDGKKGIIIEIDGSQHENDVNQRLIDETRDQISLKVQWGPAIRIKTNEWHKIPQIIEPIYQHLDEDFFRITIDNFNNSLMSNIEGIKALMIMLVPFAVARIQKTMLHLILENKLSLNDEQWNIAILERDVPCAQLAIEEFKLQLHDLMVLKYGYSKIPNINLSVESSEEFLSEFNDNSKVKSIDKKIRYDVFIDISVLLRSNTVINSYGIFSKNNVTIRSSQSLKNKNVFYSDLPIKYHPLGILNTEKNEFEKYHTQVESLENLLETIFRKSSFRPGQVEIINRAIQLNDVIGLLPTGSGKSLTYQIAALLQPGISIVVDPIKSLMKDQFEGLLKNRIDCAVYINSTLTTKEKLEAQDKICFGETLFAFISPERLQDEHFREMLLNTNNENNRLFSYCVIDEAHCVSEWGHDFRTSYLRLGDSIRKYCKNGLDKDITFFGLTATASYDVLSDIQRELKIEDDNSIVRLDSLDRPEIQFIIKEIVNKQFSDSAINKHRNELGLAKQSAICNLLKEIPHISKGESIEDTIDYGVFDMSENDYLICNDENALIRYPGIVFCPHRHGNFGVENIYQTLQIDFSDTTHTLGTYYAGDQISDRDDRNMLNQTEFVNDRINLLVATKAFGMGIDKSNIRYVIHLNYPNSIESYYQEVGRGGRDKRLALGILLYNRQKFIEDELEKSVSENGEIEEKRISLETTIDRNINLSFYKNNFKGIEKEKRVLAELLRGSTGNSVTNLKFIENQLNEIFGLNVTLNAVINKSQRKVVFINPDLGSIYLDRKEIPYYPGQCSLDNDIISKFREMIQVEKNKYDIYEWLSLVKSDVKIAGIEELLNKHNENEEFNLTVPFVNNSEQKIFEILKHYNKDIKFFEIEKASGYVSDEIEYLNKLKKIITFDVEISENHLLQIKQYFKRIRNEQDTFKAIYRLSIIGVVDDYTVDYRSQTLLLKIVKKPNGFYSESLKKYLLRYDCLESVENRISRLEFYKGTSEIQKCLGLLLKFIYEEIAEQRKESIKAMEAACNIGLENGSHAFKEFIDLYMNSKYARPQYLPKDTDHGMIADFEIVKKYIKLVKTDSGGEINNLKHLRGASTLLLVQKPDNYTFLLLKAFSNFTLIGNSREFIEEAQENLFNGFIKMSEQESVSRHSIIEYFDYFIDAVGMFNNELVNKVIDVKSILFHKIHSDWLIDYNRRIEGPYDKAN